MSRLLPIFALFLAVGLYFLYIQPTLTGSIADEQLKITSYTNALVAAKSFASKQDALVQQRAGISESNINRLQEFLPDSVDNVQLILDLTSLASKSGVVLSNFAIAQNDATAQTSGVQNVTSGALAPKTPSAFGSANLTSSLDISVDAKGTYPAFRTFLAAAEQSLRPLDVMKVTVKTSESGVYTYSITFRIYWLT